MLRGGLRIAGFTAKEWLVYIQRNARKVRNATNTAVATTVSVFFLF